MLWLLLSCRGDKVETETLDDPIPLIDFVDPMIATGGIGYGVNCGYPGPGYPLGMVKFSPDTATASGGADGYYRGGGYHYDDVQIQGFSLLHLYATGITGHGTLATMGLDGFSYENTDRDGYALEFSHDNEQASLGHYSVDLEPVSVTLRATEHTGLIQYAFTNATDPVVLIDVAHAMGNGVVRDGTISILEDGSIEGSLIMDGELGSAYPLYFYGEFDQSPSAFGVWDNEQLLSEQLSASQTEEGDRVGAYFHFPQGSTVHLRIAVSNVDLDGAKENFASEHTGFDIDEALTDTQAAWSPYFDAVDVWGGTQRDHFIFATALYHNLQMPTLFSDVDGRYRGFDGEIHTAERPFYTDFSLWDTYRTTHPLYTLLWPELHEDLLWSLVQMSLQGNGLPRWPLANTDTGVMLGTSINIVIPEAIRKGLSNFGEDEWVPFSTDAMMGRTTLSYGAPPSIDTLMEVGYYPADEVGRSVAWTQEQSIADYALGQLLIEQGNTVDGTDLVERSRAWSELWDPSVGFIHGRKRNGEFESFTSEDQWDEDYAEGNARQYLWLAPHDYAHLFELLGGNDVALERLTLMFTNMVTDEILPGLPERWYWHGNEPTLHVPYFFYLLNDRTSGNEWVQWILDNRYDDGPVGLAGNDDGGALSAWAAFAMMGLYPNAGTTDYILGQPTWDRVEIYGRTPLVLTRNGSHRNIKVNGTVWDSPTIQHDELSTIEFGTQ